MHRIAALLAAACCLAAQSQTPSYRHAVDRYRLSPNDGAEAMLALAATEREAGVDRAIASSGASAWAAADLAAAAMMHTDAAFYFLSRQEPGIAHLLLGERLLDRATSTDAGYESFNRRWYASVQAVLRVYGKDADAASFAQRDRDRFKDTPQRARARQAYRRGVLAEYDGCQKGEFLTVTGLTEAGDHLVARYFVPAARELASALDSEPALLEAALHLGRIRMLEGQDADAAKYFQMAEQSTMRSVAYLAKLFLGSLAERQAKWDEAERLYRDAAARFRAGQSAPLALAQLLDRRGRAPEAGRLLSALFDGTGATPVEPWWLYFEETGADNARRVDLLRAEILK